jgi:hypothetical protein
MVPEQDSLSEIQVVFGELALSSADRGLVGNASLVLMWAWQDLIVEFI